jgi:hypothetical protein
MDFLSKSKSKTYFDKDESDFINKIFSYMDEIEPDKINIDSLKTFSDKNTIKNTKKKLDQIIEKYNLGKILKKFEKEFIPLEISNVTQTKINSKMKNPTKKNSIKSKMKSIKGGSAATTGKGGAALAKLLLQNIKSHGIILGSTITFIEFIFIIIFVRVFIFLSDGYRDGNLTDSIRDILNNSFQKLITFYYRLRFLILNETIVIENYREIIDLPYSEITHFPADTQNAVLIDENRESQLKQRLDSLLAQYNSSQDYRIYSNLSNSEQNHLITTINQIENELADLLQPTELVYMEEVPNTSVTNGNFGSRNDIVAVPVQATTVQATNETKNLFKFFLRFCLIHYNNNNNTTTGGRTKTQSNKRKTNNKNKKIKNRTNRNKHNSRSV